MTSIRFTLATLALSTTALAHASEVTEFPITASATLTRAEVQAEARTSSVTGSMSINFAGGPADRKVPVSTRSRDEVRKEIVESRGMADSRVAGSYFVGGM
jgi:hypothetical protein